MSNGLLPCPFCGSANTKLYDRESLAWVACISCGLEAPSETGVTVDQAITYWNTRAGAAATPASDDMAALADALRTAFRRFGGIPAIGRSEGGTSTIIDICLKEVAALRSPPSGSAGAMRETLIPVSTRVRQSKVHAGTRDGTVTQADTKEFTVVWDGITVACTYDAAYLSSDARCPIIALAAPQAQEGGRQMSYDFRENRDGVHVFNGEFSLCGDAWDAPDTEADWESGPFEETQKRVVTCQRCAAVILFCRGLRVGPAADTSVSRPNQRRGE